MRSTGINDAVRADFDACLGGADGDGALALAIRLLTRGVSAEDVLLELVAPAQIEVGARWESGEWTVAREHAATHVSRQVVDAVASTARSASPFPTGAGSQAHVLVACSDGEWHILPARILCEVLRLHGFHVRSLGGSVPPYGLLSDVQQNGPDVVALSCTLPGNLPLAYRQIEACRWAGVPVVAGGAGFGPGGVWADALGADLYAPDARRGVEALIHHWPPVLRGEPSIQAGAVEAYAELTRQRPVLERLAHTPRDPFPGLRGRSGEGRDERAGLLGGLLDSLAAAVFVDDARVFTGHLDFLRRYLSARAVDPRHLLELTDALADGLRESPRAVDKLTAGHRYVAAQGDSGRP